MLPQKIIGFVNVGGIKKYLNFMSLRLPRKCPLNFVLPSFQLLKPHVEVGADVLLNNRHCRQQAASPVGL